MREVDAPPARHAPIDQKSTGMTNSGSDASEYEVTGDQDRGSASLTKAIAQLPRQAEAPAVMMEQYIRPIKLKHSCQL